MDTQVRDLLSPFFAMYDREMTPASEPALHKFKETASAKKVPPEVIDELAAFYQISDGVPCLDSFDFHKCDDPILYEWWEEDEGGLWLAQRDFYTLRWFDGKYCLGTSSTTYFDRHQYDNLVDLIEAAIREWTPTE